MMRQEGKFSEEGGGRREEGEDTHTSACGEIEVCGGRGVGGG